MYQKFLLEIFYPSNLLEIFLGSISSWVSGVIGPSQVAPLCARIVRAEPRLAVRTIHEIHVYAKGKDAIKQPDVLYSSWTE